MNTLLLKSAAGMALLVSIAATPFSGSGLAPTTEAATARSGAFSAAMLDNSKSRWAREGQVRLMEAGVGAAAGLTLLASPTPNEDPPPGETTGGSTTCPVVHTECPVQTTTCPTVLTHCPVHDTVCKTTECPASTTICPVNPTVCESTKCPQNDTYCPSIGTLCPEIPTVCPFITTRCPVDPTVCEPSKCPVPCITIRPPIVPCLYTLDVGPPAGFVGPSLVAPGSRGYGTTDRLSGAAPKVTFLPAIGG